MPSSPEGGPRRECSFCLLAPPLLLVFGSSFALHLALALLLVLPVASSVGSFSFVWLGARRPRTVSAPNARWHTPHGGWKPFAKRRHFCSSLFMNSSFFILLFINFSKPTALRVNDVDVRCLPSQCPSFPLLSNLWTTSSSTSSLSLFSNKQRCSRSSVPSARRPPRLRLRVPPRAPRRPRSKVAPCALPAPTRSCVRCVVRGSVCHRCALCDLVRLGGG